jgi:hypothetical protein
VPGGSQQPRGQRPADWLRQLEQSTDQVDTARATDTQVDTLKSILHQNQRFVDVLQRAGRLALPDWYLAAGCVAQTVWNVVTGCPPGEGIRDYDLPYFDSADLSWDAEDRVIQAAARCFADCPCSVEVRNEARVHLWYENHFGVACPPHSSTEAAIDTFPARASCVGVRLGPNDAWEVYAPYGLSDLLTLVVRPNMIQAPRHVYEAKAQRWQEQWPPLTILPWPESSPPADG